MHRPPARQRHLRGPQRVVGRGNEDFVAVVDKRLQHERDELTHPVADDDVVRSDARKPLRGVPLGDRLACGQDPARVAVSLGNRERAPQLLEDLGRRLESERRRISDVEFQDLVARALQPLRLLQDRPPHVVADACELAGLGYGAHGAILLRGRYGVGAKLRPAAIE